MKDQPVAKAWLGYGALLVLGCAAIFAWNQSSHSEADGTRGDMDGETAIRPGPTTRGHDRISHAEPRAADQGAPKTDDRLPVEETRQQAVGSRATGKPEVVARGGCSKEMAEKPLPRNRDEVRGDDPDSVAVNASAAPLPGIQLAPDVRLPLAALPIDFQTNEVTARMLDIIVSDYYRDLASGVTGEADDEASTRIEDNGETTIVVKNGPAAEAARQRADWRFRAIFGKDAFNRMSMQSNLEARLPVADAE